MTFSMKAVNDVLRKYIDKKHELIALGKVASEMSKQHCQYCKAEIERDKYHAGTCAHCGAELPPEPLGYCYGLPVTNREDAELLNALVVYENIA